MLAASRLAALGWIRSQQLTAEQAKPLTDVATLPQQPVRVVKVGAWYTNPLCQQAAFWAWDERFGSHRGNEPTIAV